jgi:hypothetical protein
MTWPAGLQLDLQPPWRKADLWPAAYLISEPSWRSWPHFSQLAWQHGWRMNSPCSCVPGLPDDTGPPSPLLCTADKRSPATAAAAAQQLALGPFTLEPAAGEVAPGARQEVSVVFRAEPLAALSKERLLVLVAERDPADQPNGIPLELTGESCVPGAWVGAAGGQRRACRLWVGRL